MEKYYILEHIERDDMVFTELHSTQKQGGLSNQRKAKKSG